MERANFALRLLPSLYKAAQRIAEQENCSVNQLINIALAEKIAILDEGNFEARRRRAIAKGTSGVLQRLAGNQPIVEGDEVPQRSSRDSTVRTLKAGGG